MSDSIRRWWPLIVAGFVGPVVAHLFMSWMRPSVAVGVAFFLAGIAAGLVFIARPPVDGWRFSRFLGGAALGATVAGLLAFVIHGR